MKVAIIGGGLTGLATAYYLGKAKPQWKIDLYEKANRFGGKIQTKRVDGYVVETGPDSYLARKVELTHLIEDIGLGDTLVANATGQAYVYDRNRMHPIPGGSIVGIPTEFIPFAKASLISWFGKIRAGLDVFKSPYPCDGDVAMGPFFKYHLGQEMVDKLIEPLLSGIYGGDINSLSLDATFPDFHRLEQTHGNMVKGMWAMKKKQAQAMSSRKTHTNQSQGMFRQVTGGLESIIEGLVKHMPENVRLFTSHEVSQLELDKSRAIYTLELTNSGSRDKQSYQADKVILTTPPQAYKNWFKGDTIIEKVAHMSQSSCAIAIMAFPKDSFDAPLEGTGFVITRKTDTPLTACTYISKKWPQTTPQDKVVLRVFLGKAGDSTVDTLSDEELKVLALTEIQKIMGFTVKPLWIELTRLKKSMPQYVVGHRTLVEEVRNHVKKQYPHLHLIGTPFDGVGMPDGVKQAKALVDSLMESKDV